MYLIKYDKNTPLINSVQEDVNYSESYFSVEFDLQSPNNDIGVKVGDIIAGLEQHFKDLLNQSIVSNKRSRALEMLVNTLVILEKQYEEYQHSVEKQKY